MNAETSLIPVVLFMVTDSQLMQATQACSRDYGFDVDEEEIARAMLAPVPASLSVRATFEPGVDESDPAPLWFLS